MNVWLKSTLWAVVAAASLMVSIVTSSCGFHHLKYENPITKDTQQPDKALYDKAIKDLEKGRYELARLTLNTLINTYESSEFLAKSKLAIADSWYREGGVSGLAQAEALAEFNPTARKLARRFGNCVPFRHGIWGRAVRGRGIGVAARSLAAYRPDLHRGDVHPGRGRGDPQRDARGDRTECRGCQIPGAERERRRRGVTTPWR